MPQQLIINTPANGGGGDTAYQFTTKVNEMMAELYARALAELTDVDVAGSPGPSDGDVLTYDASVSPPVWRAATPADLGFGSGAEELLDEVSPTGTGTVTFSGIDQGYTDLRVVVRGRGTNVSTSVPVNFRLNGDSGGNYDAIGVNSNGSVLVQYNTAATAQIQLGSLPAASAPTGVASAAEYRIYNYADTNLHKAVGVKAATKLGSAVSDLFPRDGMGFYRSASAITQVDVILNAGNFATGSKVSLYGIR